VTIKRKKQKIMSQASYHEGLSIEPDVFLQTLRIEGQLIGIQKEGAEFVFVRNHDIRDTALDQLAIKIIDTWAEFLDKRNNIREEHLKRLDDAIRHGVMSWNQWRKENPQIRPLLYNADLIEKHLSSEKDPIDFSNANLIRAKLMRAHLQGANFHEANLGNANLFEAQLTGAHFCRTDLYKTILSKANLHCANLQGTQMAMTYLREAILTECKVYGVSAWDLEMEGATQRGFKIIYTSANKKGILEERLIEVDDLRVAQFIYLLLHNKNIRYAIDTITAKAVLILGRFSDKRKEVLDAIRDALREEDKLVPIIFDFEPGTNRDLTETVRLLADMSKFVIADITEARSISQELDEIVPFLPSVPIIPILLKNTEEYPLFKHWRKYPWVSKVFFYDDKDHLITDVKKEILKAVQVRLDHKKNMEEFKKNEPILYQQLRDRGIIVD
jgi:uncharacterized protein YjbI with pentapeptide repeats